MKALIRTTITALLAVLLPAVNGRGQIINDWSNNEGIVSTLEEGTIDDETYAAQGIFSDWNKILDDFEHNQLDDVELDKEIQNVRSNAAFEAIRTLRDRNGVELRLPEIIDEEGTDLYLLTKEGMTIYMALDAPVYLQDVDDDVAKWVRYYAHQKRAYTKKMFQRYTQWEPYLKDLFRRNGVPEELAELCLVESGCTYKALSSAGALGMWQIMPDTGRSFGMVINLMQDDRTDPVRSSNVAVRILKSNYAKIGEWTLAAAAYNCGSGRIASKGKVGNQWSDIRPFLPKETQQYIPCLLAIHYIWTYRDKLGL